MGFENEVERSIARPCRHTDGRSKRTCELTSSIVPRGTSFHRSVELEFPPIGCHPARFSCCYGLLPGPPELGAVNPDAVHDHGQPACQGDDRLFHPAAPGDLHRPGLEPRPFMSALCPKADTLDLHVSVPSRPLNASGGTIRARIQVWR